MTPYHQAITAFKAWRATNADLTKLSLDELNALRVRFIPWGKNTKHQKVRFWQQEIKKEISRRDPIPPNPQNSV